MRFIGGRRMAPPLSRVVQERIAYADIAAHVGLEGETPDHD